MEERIYTVYMHTNKLNNKKYIGITRQKPSSRWNSGHGYKRNPYFFKSIKKNGWDGFKHEVILQNLTKEEAEMFEIAMIKYYKTTDKRLGYNSDNGGNSPGKMTQQSKQKLININSKKIICIETKEVFNSAKDAGNKLGIDYATIGRCCRKEFHIGAGFHWAFYDEYIKNPDDNIYLTSRKKTGKTVYCEETKEYYPSLKHVSDLFKIDLSYLGKCMRKGKICKGYRFKYIDKQE